MSVKLSDLGRALPTFSLGLLKSLFFSFFFLALDPMALQGHRRLGLWLVVVAVVLSRKPRQTCKLMFDMLSVFGVGNEPSCANVRTEIGVAVYLGSALVW